MRFSSLLILDLHHAEYPYFEKCLYLSRSFSETYDRQASVCRNSTVH